MAWEIEFTNEFGAWYRDQEENVQDQIYAAVDLLRELGPGLRRPTVGKIEGSRHANMKELIPAPGNIRILFCFDPRRMAILLLGGDKTNQWRDWYRVAIPEADRLYDEYLEELRQEGLLP